MRPECAARVSAAGGPESSKSTTSFPTGWNTWNTVHGAKSRVVADSYFGHDFSRLRPFSEHPSRMPRTRECRKVLAKEIVASGATERQCSKCPLMTRLRTFVSRLHQSYSFNTGMSLSVSRAILRPSASPASFENR